MSGLVASGMVLVILTPSNWLLGRLIPAYEPPRWWWVWLFCALPVAAGIYLITTRLNAPVLPAPLGGAVVLATLVGLALALLPGRMAARRPRELLWLTLSGAGLMGSLLLLRAVELPATGLVKPGLAYGVAAVGTLGGACWSLVVGWLYAQRREEAWTPFRVFISGVTLSYLVIPLVHYLLFTPLAYRYISLADNFFARTIPLQLFSFAVAGGLSLGVVRLQYDYLRSIASVHR
jgi:hypothetical protein